MADNIYPTLSGPQLTPDPFAGMRAEPSAGMDRRAMLQNFLRSIPALSIGANAPNLGPVADGLAGLLQGQGQPQDPEEVRPIASMNWADSRPVQEPTVRSEEGPREPPREAPAVRLGTGDQGLATLNPDVEGLIRQRAAAYGVQPEAILRLARAEGGGYNNVSPAGARGPMQLMPETARELGVNPHDWRANVDGGVRYFKSLLDKFGGNYQAAAAAYNAGPNRSAVARFATTGDPSGLPLETREYIKKIFGGF